MSIILVYSVRYIIIMLSARCNERFMSVNVYFVQYQINKTEYSSHLLKTGKIKRV